MASSGISRISSFSIFFMICFSSSGMASPEAASSGCSDILTAASDSVTPVCSSVLSGSNAVFSGCIGTCSSFMVFTGFSTGGFSTDGFSTGVPQFSQNRSPAFNSYPQFVQNIEAPFSVRTLADNRRAADHRQILSMCRNIFMNDLCFYAISITQRFSVCQTIIHPSPV